MRKMILAMGALAAACSAVPAAATAILTDQWYSFSFGGVGFPFAQGFNGDPSTDPASLNAPDPDWEFTLLTAGSITFVDAFNVGDQFTITDFGSSIGTTSAPGAGAGCGNDITACLNDPDFSKGTFALGAGSHSINGTPTASPFGSGGAFFRVNSTAVPEPATWAMMLLGFAGIGFAMRKRAPDRLAKVA